ncbi:MAG: methyltransferase domain-containing protein [Thermoleophilia bacterium]|nr:methyltransferase domain-containing protein [Thermoleophilia bacterium]
MSEPRFQFEQVFDEDYLYFYEPWLTDEVSDAETEVIWRVLELEAGTAVLDLGCGHGRIANRLAARGCRVTGLDVTPLFLERARGDAAERGVEVEYVQGDMRTLPWTERFDRALLWFTTFGYFGDEDNRRVLAEACASLRPGGRLAIELHNRDVYVRRMLPMTGSERDGDLLVDRHRFDVHSGRTFTERVVVRGGRVRKAEFSVRFFTFTELRDWLLAAGFARVDGYDADGGELTEETRRMIVVGTR